MVDGSMIQDPSPDVQGMVVGVALAALGYYFLSRPRGIPPGPRGLPLAGNLFQLTYATHIDFMKMGEKYGDIFSIYMGTKLVIVLNSYRAIKEALVNKGPAFMDRPKGLALAPDCVSLFMEPWGERLMHDKKFAVTALRASGWGTPVIEERIVNAVDELGALLQSRGPQPQDVTDPINYTTAKIICATLFSKQYALDDPEMHDLVGWVGKILGAFTSDCPIADFMPTWLAPVIFSKLIHDMRAFADGASEACCLKAVKEHRASLDPEHPRDFLDHYLLEKSPRGDPYTDKELAAHCLTFTVDAIFSIGTLILWHVFFLAKFPDWQSKVQTEVDEVVGPSKQPRTTDKASMPNTEAFQLEVMRVSSLCNFTFPHKPLEDTTLCGFHIPENARLLGNFWSVNRDPKLWPEPEKFRPQRHLDAEGKFMQTDKVMLFSQGIRQCMGQQLVRTEAFLFTARLLQRFHFRFPVDKPEPRLEDVVENMVRIPPPFQVSAIPR